MMTTCPGCSQPLEPLAQIRTYHAQCDPQGRVERLERVLASWREKYELEEDGRRFVSIPLSVFDSALAYQPAQMKGMEG
jgi:hypothetical protein